MDRARSKTVQNLTPARLCDLDCNLLPGISPLGGPVQYDLVPNLSFLVSFLLDGSAFSPTFQFSSRELRTDETHRLGGHFAAPCRRSATAETSSCVASSWGCLKLASSPACCISCLAGTRATRWVSSLQSLYRLLCSNPYPQASALVFSIPLSVSPEQPLA